MDYDLIVVKTLERVYKNYYYIIRGDKVRVLFNVDYDTDRAFNLYYDEYDVIQVNGDRAVIGIGNTVTSAIDVHNIERI